MGPKAFVESLVAQIGPGGLAIENCQKAKKEGEG
jgi:hypothetical protein